jgi:hypothetical protein
MQAAHTKTQRDVDLVAARPSFSGVVNSYQCVTLF